MKLKRCETKSWNNMNDEIYFIGLIPSLNFSSPHFKFNKTLIAFFAHFFRKFLFICFWRKKFLAIQIIEKTEQHFSSTKDYHPLNQSTICHKFILSLPNKGCHVMFKNYCLKCSYNLLPQYCRAGTSKWSKLLKKISRHQILMAVICCKL